MRVFHSPVAAATALACTGLFAPEALAQALDQTAGDRRGEVDAGQGQPVPSAEGAGGFARPDPSLSLGLVGAVLPTFQGSKDSRLLPFPLIDARWGRFFIEGVDGLGVNAIETERFTAGASVTWVQGYRRKDVPDGVDRVATAAGARAFARARVGGVTFSAGATQALGGTKGVVADLGLSYYARLGDRLALIPSLETTWANRKHMDRYFGIDADEARASGLSAFSAKSGFKDVSANLFATYRLSDRWQLVGQAGATRLVGDAKDSPLNETGWNATGLVGVTYKFR